MKSKINSVKGLTPVRIEPVTLGPDVINSNAFPTEPTWKVRGI